MASLQLRTMLIVAVALVCLAPIITRANSVEQSKPQEYNEHEASSRGQHPKLKPAPASEPHRSIRNQGSTDAVEGTVHHSLPSARLVSNAVFKRKSTPSRQSALLMYFAQFVADDIFRLEDRNGSPCNGVPEAEGQPTANDDDDTSERMDIEVPRGDVLDRMAPNTSYIPYTRTKVCHVARGGRLLINAVSSSIDASQVYGSDDSEVEARRLHSCGLLKDPLKIDFHRGPFCDGGIDCLTRGEVRTSRFGVLPSLHVLFARHHNRIAQQLCEAQSPDDGGDSDEDIYWKARQQVVADVQSIVFGEFASNLLGASCPALGYTGSSPAMNATDRQTADAQQAFLRRGSQVVVEFTMAARAVLHGFPVESKLVDETGAEVGTMQLVEEMMKESDMSAEDVRDLLLGSSAQPANKIDAALHESLRTLMLHSGGEDHDELHAVDIAAMAIQQSRDHGVMGYNELRRVYGLPPVRSFGELSSKRFLVAALQNTYGTIDRLDAYVGGLLEDPVGGSAFGPLFSRILCRQLTFLRDSDPNYFEVAEVFSEQDRERIRSMTLGDVLTANLPELDGGEANVDLFLVRDGRPEGAVDCAVGEWSQFGPCTRECGGGRQRQTRKVLVEPAMGGMECPPLLRVVPCNLQDCDDDGEPRDCKVSDWKDFGQCSASCGGGVIKQYRRILERARNGGQDCPDLYRAQPCNEQPCTSVNGGSEDIPPGAVVLAPETPDCLVSDWEEPTPCSKTCGGGIQMQKRKIIQKSEQGGPPCPALVRAWACNTQACPTNDTELSESEIDRRLRLLRVPCRQAPRWQGLPIRKCLNLPHNETCHFAMPDLGTQCEVTCLYGHWTAATCYESPLQADVRAKQDEADSEPSGPDSTVYTLQIVAAVVACLLVALVIIVTVRYVKKRRGLANISESDRSFLASLFGSHDQADAEHDVESRRKHRLHKRRHSDAPGELLRAYALNMDIEPIAEDEVLQAGDVEFSEPGDNNHANVHTRAGYTRRASTSWFNI